ncbi:MAG TPA: GFA family protein, partial [Acetobacteraceae bacterium]|nr:GFA family protein [Acetobacteraceae bacterium]
MQLEGSCHCRGVRFALNSRHPVPYQRCYCSICRKQQGGSGYTINLSGDAASLRVEGRENVTIYHAHLSNPGERDHISSAERAFCRVCGSALWLFSPEWPELIHPFASAIDTDLPDAP